MVTWNERSLLIGGLRGLKNNENEQTIKNE